jgi:Ca2+-binding EF-hand superfamily protein
MKVIVTLLALAAIATVTVNAQDAGKKKAPSPEEMFKKLDKDSNGSVSKEEFLASPGAKKDATKAEERFKKMDKNGDGALSMEEMTPKKKK